MICGKKKEKEECYKERKRKRKICVKRMIGEKKKEKYNM